MPVRQVSFYVGEVQFVMDVDGDTDAFQKMQFYFTIPSVCAVCGCAVVPNYYKTKPPGNFEYYGVKCKGENEKGVVHQLNFHQHKEGGGFYIKQGEATNPKAWTTYDPSKNVNGDDEEGTAASAAAPETAEDLAKVAETLKDNVTIDEANGAKIFRLGAFVVSGKDGKAVCDCKRFQAGVAANPDFSCEHLLAVRLHLAALKTT